MQDAELARLRAENDDLRRRVELAEAGIAELRAEALERRQSVRELVADLPVVVSRKTLLKQMASDAIHHPDKAGVVRRIAAKLARGARKVVKRQ
jgi:hypothetical protein